MIEQIKNNLNIKQVIDYFGLQYYTAGHKEYGLYDEKGKTNGRRFNTEKNLATDFSNKGRPQGDVISFVEQYQSITTKEAIEYINSNILLLNNNKMPLQSQKTEIKSIDIVKVWRGLPTLDQRQQDYLKKRCIDYEKVKGFVKDYNGAIGCIVSDGTKPVGLCARILTDDSKNRFTSLKGSNGNGVYKTQLDPNNKNIIVCEGLMDFLTVRQFYQNVVGLRNSELGLEVVEMLSKDYNIILINDNDEAGKKTITELKKITNFKLADIGNYKDLNEAVVSEGINKQFFIDLEVNSESIICNNIQSAFDKFKWYSDRMIKCGMLGEPGPYKELDKITSGIIPGKVYAIGAFANTGKSKFSYNYVNHFLKNNKKVLFFSLEVDSGMLLGDLACSRYKREWIDIVKYQDINLNDFNNLKIYDDCYFIDDIIEKTEKENPDVIFIDFIQNVQNRKGDGGYELTAKVAKEIQKLAITTNTTVFSLSQLSNAGGKEIKAGNFDSVNLKGAGELLASSDVVFLLKNKEKKGYAGEDNIMEMNIKKNKYGKKGDTFNFKVEFAKSNFIYLGKN